MSLPVCRASLRSEVSNILDLIIPQVKRETFTARAFSVKGPVLWNQLLNCIQAIKDFKTFKKHLKHSISQKCLVGNKYYLIRLCIY